MNGPMARLIYCGIDEAGYGPMLGPLVVTRTVLELSEYEGAPAEAHVVPPPLWTMLKSAVCRKASDKRRRIAVNDSKQLYSPATGLAHLERGVLSFCHLAGVEPGCVQQWLQRVAHEPASALPDLLWYSPAHDGPVLPVALTAGELAVSRASLKRAAEAAKLRVHHLAAAVIYENRFNELVAATQSKARCAWAFVAQHIDHVWQNFGELHPLVVVDRQGGRKVYHELLSMMYPAADIRLMDESDHVSRYRITHGPRTMTLSFEVESEKAHMPVALASMTAKYVRELLMHRFNAFWAQHNPDLRPTAGYYGDGQRFLNDIAPLLTQLQIDRTRLVRSC